MKSPKRPQTAMKKVEKLIEKLEAVPDLTEHERILWARMLAATPDQRWNMNVTYLRSHGLWKRSKRIELGLE